MDWMKLATDLANAAKSLVPGVGVVEGAVDIGKKLVDLIDHVTEKVPETQGSADLAIARKELADRVQAKAEATAERLEGDN